jgi:hypothetical protein
MTCILFKENWIGSDDIRLKGLKDGASDLCNDNDVGFWLRCFREYLRRPSVTDLHGDNDENPWLIRDKL